MIFRNIVLGFISVTIAGVGLISALELQENISVITDDSYSEYDEEDINESLDCERGHHCCYPIIKGFVAYHVCYSGFEWQGKKYDMQISSMGHTSLAHYCLAVDNTLPHGAPCLADFECFFGNHKTGNCHNGSAYHLRQGACLAHDGEVAYCKVK